MTETLAARTTVAGPVQRAERALAPDLARGAMLLFIALANAANCAFAGQPGIDGTPHGWERVVNFFMVTFVHSRAYPVFAVMFGYGLVQLARRHEAAGTDARRILLRRNAFLLGFGVLHGTLLYFGDFLGAYGIVGVIATLILLRRGDRFHRVVLWLWTAQLAYLIVLPVLVLVHGRSGRAILTNIPDPSLAATSYGRSVLDRLTEWPQHTLTVIPIIVIAWLGMWAARRRILENPAAHRVLLRRTAIGCLTIVVLGALPYALIAAGLVHADAGTIKILSLLHDVSGEYGGPGYVALIGLLALRLSDRRRPVVNAIAALGQRSLSGYLFQSVAWMILFAPFALDLGGSTYPALLAGLGVWTVSVLAAWAMDRWRYRGPAEHLLRRLTYRHAQTGRT
ncbi:DUF418 domain-containing protein [Rugosimonospora africana]|uniref:DUF418 domain-containing protein n=1 Tax=Rugosimonospora africana TaxID=556532 RepID=A0A8J3QN41_9ACTN|nr:DUF418 domain-containing protein [Rugosimonospora africana]GIH13022.1 hypothetical protein Raf01_11940 [Rugosimonospora africana]